MLKSHRLLIVVILFILSWISLAHYLNIKHASNSESFDVIISKMITIVFFNLFFYSLIFLVNIKYYKHIFKIVLITLTILWLYELISWAYFDVSPISLQFGDFWEVIILISFSLLAQGLIIYIIHYIKKSTAKYSEAKVFGKYHIHEGFVGIIFITVAIFLLVLRSSLLFLTDILWKRLYIYLWLVQIFLFVFLYLGSFFLFRDWHDVIRLNFIEKKNLANENDQNNQSPVFNRITREDIHFFKHPKLCIYPFGIIATIFALNAIVFGTNFLPIEIFNLENESVILLGYFLSFIAGGMIGIDWLRLFRKIYPKLYEELAILIKNIKIDTSI